MKTTTTLTAADKLMTRFDKELKAILKNDLKDFDTTQGKFLNKRNSLNIEKLMVA